MAFLVAGLLGLIFGYRVKSEHSLFTDVSNSDVLRDHTVVLVNYSATRIVFVASWASTLAPLLAGFVMSLLSFRTALMMFHSSSSSEQADLPTPYQYSLLVGLCLASIGRLRRYFSYSAETDVVVPPILRRAARNLTLTLVLACIVFGADTAVHYSTSTIAFDQISIPQEKLAYGRALSEACLTLSRLDNLGLPCSRNGITAVDDYDTYAAGQNEIFFLNHDTSSISKIVLVDSDPRKGVNASTQVALLIPQPSTLSPFRDFRAETAGVIMTCKAVTNTQCNWTDGVLGEETFSQFNCSDNFYGILGKMASIDDSGHMIKDPDVPTLATKPGSVIQYAYFQDSDLNIPYDAVGDLGTFLGDSQLINPVYVAIAARFATISQRAGVDMTSDTGIHHVGTTANLDLVLNCQYTTYVVDYSWVNSTARVNQMTASPNGTLAELFPRLQLRGRIQQLRQRPGRLGPAGRLDQKLDRVRRVTGQRLREKDHERHRPVPVTQRKSRGTDPHPAPGGQGPQSATRHPRRLLSRVRDFRSHGHDIGIPLPARARREGSRVPVQPACSRAACVPRHSDRRRGH